MFYRRPRSNSIRLIPRVMQKPSDTHENLSCHSAYPSAVNDRNNRLALHVVRFPEVIDLVLETLMPNVLTDYLFELSGKFNDFYRDCRVLGDEHQDSRLLICEATAILMRQLFQLLGLRPVYKL
jgi:arginyl-tRNA synthetase